MARQRTTGARLVIAGTRARLWPLAAATYRRHALHGDDRVWQETNCYVDLWVEVVHALGLDPMPALAFTLALDFEGDQYTFYKFGLADLHTLYGIDVQELNIWQPLVEHAVEQVSLGRLFIPEVDSFWLPDTAGVSYRIDHTKSSIAIQDIDVAAKHLGYFHGAAYHELSGDDFDGVFRLAPGLSGPHTLPPYTEIAKVGALTPYEPAELAARASALTRTYVGRRPAVNPITKHRDRFASDLEWLRASDNPNLFHLYAFATFRQLGSCFEVAGSFLRWLGERDGRPVDAAVAGCDTIARTAKTLQFKLARAVTLKRDVDFDALFGAMTSAWDDVMGQLATQYEG